MKIIIMKRLNKINNFGAFLKVLSEAFDCLSDVEVHSETFAIGFYQK